MTTVAHEMGHALGLDDLTSAADAHDLMYVGLVDGERRLPSAADVKLADASTAAAELASRSGTAGTGERAATKTADPSKTADATHVDTELARPGGQNAPSHGSDSFVFDESILGSSGSQSSHSPAPGGTIDLTTLFSGQSEPELRVAEATGGTGATLQVHQGDHWADIAHLDGFHVGDTVNVATDPAHIVHLSAALFA